MLGSLKICVISQKENIENVRMSRLEFLKMHSGITNFNAAKTF